MSQRDVDGHIYFVRVVCWGDVDSTAYRCRIGVCVLSSRRFSDATLQLLSGSRYDRPSDRGWSLRKESAQEFLFFVLFDRQWCTYNRKYGFDVECDRARERGSGAVTPGNPGGICSPRIEGQAEGAEYTCCVCAQMAHARGRTHTHPEHPLARLLHKVSHGSHARKRTLRKVPVRCSKSRDNYVIFFVV